ncbi:hypothetical protein GDO81_015455 [Engystomops pustulosus]|uniref:Uncharacterized protein n=1 Tax=Engystomops pustulosus TaxID=76066 RepID=A0AAV7AKJ0_ENGPU|nr:hypothetical protein GDO81_015455 [Engystomops pustulosus]
MRGSCKLKGSRKASFFLKGLSAYVALLLALGCLHRLSVMMQQGDCNEINTGSANTALLASHPQQAVICDGEDEATSRVSDFLCLHNQNLA